MTSVPSDVPDVTLDAPRAPAPKGKIVHPLWVRLCHWINAFAILLMVMSGWRIYDASPIWHFKFRNADLAWQMAGRRDHVALSRRCGFW